MTTTPSRLGLPHDVAGHPPVTVQVWGEAALFTRPEFKAERITYPIMTPSAAKGVLEAIYWKREIRYRVLAIEMLKPVREFTVRRNETSHVVSLREARQGACVDTVAHRDQRNAVCLRDVAYRIHAHVQLQPHADKPVAAYRDQMRRRVDRGQCFQQPYLGAKEFTASFGPVDDTPAQENHTEELGIMIHTVAWDPDETMKWFTARIDKGVMHVPERGIPAGLPAAETAVT